MYNKNHAHHVFKRYYVGDQEKHLSITTSYISNSEEHYVLIMLSDITELYDLRDAKLALEKNQRLTEQLRRIKEEAERANEAKSMFLSNMSHEIRTPINAVLGMNEMILREYDDPQLLEYAANIQSAGRTLLYLINDILDISKIESGKMEIIPTEYRTGDVFRELYQMILFRAQEKGLELSFQIHDLPERMYGDDVRIKQILTNLLTNAVKYTKTGSVTLEASYDAYDEQKGILRVQVKDTGMDIRKEDMGKLFENFQRLDEQENRHIEGTGLGMSITVSLLHMMHGDIRVESEYGKGSVFTVEIPQERISDAVLEDWSKVQLVNLSDISTRELYIAPRARLLVVDDNPMNLKVVVNLLKRIQVQLTCAESGAQCLELLEQHSYDLIFLDHMMPDMDGIETLKKIEEQLGANRPPVIALTANAIAGAREQYAQAGFDDFLTKPIDSEKLECMIAEYLPKELIEPVDNLAASDKRSANRVQQPSESRLSEHQIKQFAEDHGIDVGQALQYAHNDWDFLTDLLTQYVEYYEKRREDLNSYVRAADYKQYGILTHAMKGDSRMLGAVDFGELCQLHENAGKAADAAYIKAQFEVFLEQYGQLVEGYRKLLEAIRQADKARMLSAEGAGKSKGAEAGLEAEKQVMSVEQMDQKLAEIKTLIDAFEEEKAAVIIHELLEYPWTKEQENMLRSAVHAIEKEYDADKALEILQKWSE